MKRIMSGISCLLLLYRATKARASKAGTAFVLTRYSGCFDSHPRVDTQRYTATLVQLLMALSIGIFASTCFGQVSAKTADSIPPRPRAEVAQKTFDFGTIPEGNTVQHDFVIRNRGDAELVLHRVVATCGCTASTVSPGPILPGAEGTVHVEFKSAGFSGAKTKSVHVFTSDPDQSVIELTISGTVQPEVLIEPSHVDFGEVAQRDIAAPPGTSSTGAEKLIKTVTVAVRPGATSRLGAVRSLSPKISVTEVSSGKLKKTLQIRLSSSLSFGDIRERVIVDLVGARTSSVVIPVFAAVRSDLKLEPAVVSFGIIEGTEVLKRAVKLTNLRDTVLQVVSIRSSEPALVAKAREIKPGKQFSIDLSLTPAVPPRDVRATVTLVTKVTERGAPDVEQELILNVYGISPPPAS